MKKKKLLLLVSMIAVMISMSACKQKSYPDPFVYSKDSVTTDCQQFVAQVVTLSDKDQEYVIHESSDEYIVDAVQGYQTAKSEAGTPQKFGDTAVTNKEDSVIVDVEVEFSERVVDFEFTLVSNPKYSYDNTVASYIVSQVVVTPQYSMGELMERAAINTLMGMGTVFIVLIFISFIIGFFKYIPVILAKKEKKEKAKLMEKEVATVQNTQVVTANENLLNDSELVAVITAAIYAATAENPVASQDQLIVRSIKRVAR